MYNLQKAALSNSLQHLLEIFNKTPCEKIIGTDFVEEMMAGITIYCKPLVSVSHGKQG